VKKLSINYVSRTPTELKRCAKHIEPRHKKHMEYDGMIRGVVNQVGKDR
jgi:hypothetical protein